jgi:hypothetical protein
MARLTYTSILIALVATCTSAQAQQQGGGSAAQIMSSIPANAHHALVQAERLRSQRQQDRRDHGRARRPRGQGHRAHRRRRRFLRTRTITSGIWS